MDSRMATKGGKRAGANGADRPASEARRIVTSVGLSAPEGTYLTSKGLVMDAITGALDSTQVNAACTAIKTMIGVAHSADVLHDMDGRAEAYQRRAAPPVDDEDDDDLVSEASKAAEVKALRKRLAELEGRRAPQKG